MKVYCENALEYHCSMLMRQFEKSSAFECPTCLHRCCDICLSVCKCSDCEKLPATVMCSSFAKELIVPPSSTYTSSGKPTPEKQKEIYQALVGLRKGWCANSGTAYLLVCTGLSHCAINYIATNLHNLSTEEQLSELGIASHNYCKGVLSLLTSF